MNIFVYALVCYAITAVISCGVVALMILLNKIMSRSDTNAANNE